MIQRIVRRFGEILGVVAPSQGGVPAGGSTGQALVKASTADYDHAWSAPAVRVPAIVPTSVGTSAGIFANPSAADFAEPVWYVGLPGSANGMGIQANGITRFDAGAYFGPQLVLVGGAAAPNGLSNTFFGTAVEVDLAFDATLGDSLGWVRHESTYSAVRVTGQARSSTNALVDVGEAQYEFAERTHATRKGRARHRVADAGGAREYLAAESDGARALLGFFGAAPVARPAAPTTLADVIAALRALGLVT